MLSVASVQSAGGMAGYLGKDNYYANEDPAEQSMWGGEGARMLGLTGDDLEQENQTQRDGDTAPNKDAEPEIAGEDGQPGTAEGSKEDRSEGAEERSDGEAGNEPGGDAEGPTERGGESEVIVDGAGESAAKKGERAAQEAGEEARPNEDGKGEKGTASPPETKVDKDAFEAILNGKLPNGTQIGTPGKRAIGTDLTFSASKSVSIMALVFGDKRVTEAHITAVKTAMNWAEKNLAEGRRDIDGRKVPIRTGNFVYAMFGHDTSRALDPQLHTHVVVANVTRMPDGKWQSLHNGQIWRNNTTLGSIYQAKLREGLEKLGYEVEKSGKHGAFEIKGITRDQIEALSLRRQEIVARSEALGIHSPKGRDGVTVRTRDTKVEVEDRGALTHAWQAKAAELGLDGAKMVADAAHRADPSMGIFDRGRAAVASILAETRDLLTSLRRPDDPLVDRGLARFAKSPSEVRSQLAVASAVRILSEREAAFRPELIAKTALDLHLSGVTIDRVELRVAQLVNKGELVLGAPRDDGTVTMITTREALATENAILSSVERGKGSVAPMVQATNAMARIEHAASDRALNAGQMAAATMIISSSDRIVAIQGVAGAGKSTMLAAVAEIAREQGVKAVGLAFQNKMVADLREGAGLDAMTTASFMLRLERQLADPKMAAEARAEWRGAYLLLDEASMTSNGDMLRLARIAERLEVGRFAIVGDRQQLAAIDAGKSFSLMQEGGVGMARMDENLRQTTPLLRSVAALANRGEAGKALGLLRDKVIEAPGTDPASGLPARVEQAAITWLALSADERSGTALFTSGRETRAQLNERVQDGLREEGTLAGNGLRLTVRDPVNTTREELRLSTTYETGQLLELSGRVDAIGLRRGEYLVMGVKNGRVELDALGRKVKFDPAKIDPHDKQLGRMGLANEKEIKLHEGDRIMWRANDKERDLLNATDARVLAIDGTGVTVEQANGTQLTLAIGDPMLRRLDLAYTLNMHMAQGVTAEKGIAVMGAGERNLSNQRLFNVAITRVRDDVIIITDDAKRLAAQIDRTPGNKTSALEEVGRLVVDAERDVGSRVKTKDATPNPAQPVDPRFKHIPPDILHSVAGKAWSPDRAPPQLSVPERAKDLSL